MRSAQITIKDIAKKLGISPSTVSRALKGHPEISAETRKAVNDLAEKLKYEPNAVALSLQRSRTNIIGLIIPEIVHYFFSQVISGIEDVANDAGFQVMICQSNESYTREVSSVQALLASRIDGLLVSVSKETKDFSHFRNLKKKNIPIVFFDRICEEIDSDKVIVDDFNGAYKAVEHLINIGCKRIAHLSTNQNLLIGKNRYEGYLKALRDFELPVDERLIVRCDTHKAARLVTKRLIYELHPPDGIFAVNAQTAIGAIQTVKENGLRIPEDIAVVGFSNDIYCTMSDPQLTSFDQFGYLMGQKAARMILDRILSKQDYPASTEIIETQLIIRESTVKRKVYPY
jgi:DNA-binding LacI/PurR family transcriptional regulator